MQAKEKNLIEGFTLIELLVVVALIGIISSIGIVAYNGYTTSAQQKAAENTLQAMAIAQLEYKSNRGSFFRASQPTSANANTTTEVNINLFQVNPVAPIGVGTQDRLSGQNYWYTSDASLLGVAPATYLLRAQQKDGTCVITLNQDSILTKTSC